MKISIALDRLAINLYLLAVCCLLLFKLLATKNASLDMVVALSFVFLSFLTIGYCIFGGLSKAIYLVVSVICFEPVIAFLVPEIGRSFVAYFTALSCGVLFLRTRDASLISSVVFFISFVSFGHFVVHLFTKSEGFSLLFDEAYRADFVRGCKYLGGAFLLSSVAGWRPTAQEFYQTVKVSAQILVFGIVCSLVYFVQEGGSLDIKYLAGSRLHSVGDQGANTFSINALLALFCVIAIIVRDKMNLWWLGSILLCLFAVVFSKSRAQMLAFLAFLPFVSGAIKGNLIAGLRNYSFIYLVAGLAIVIVGIFGAAEFLEFEDRDVTKLTGRTEIWAISISILLENLIFGVADIDYNNYMASYDLAKYGGGGLTPHNPFMNIFVFSGVIAGALFIVAHVFIISKVIKKWRHVDRSHRVILLTSAFVIVAHQSSDIWYSLYFWFLSWAMIEYRSGWKFVTYKTTEGIGARLVQY